MLPAPDANTNIGRAIYSRDCSVCHGDRGDAASWAKNSLNPTPSAFTAHGLDQLTREKMIETVTFGSKNTAMMPFAVQLSHQEIAATVDYIRAAFMPEGMGPGMAGHDHGGGHDQGGDGAQGHGDHQEAGHQEAGHEVTGAGDAPFPAGQIGDPVWGKTFYDANCAECHGPKGNGEGRRAYFMIVKPKDFLSREARTELVRPKLFDEISEGVTGTTMPSWAKVLTSQQIADVAEYVYRAFLHPDRFAAIEVPAAPLWQSTGAEPAGVKKTDMPGE
jgi:mono/diheme cytochrome c family protein